MPATTPLPLADLIYLAGLMCLVALLVVLMNNTCQFAPSQPKNAEQFNNTRTLLQNKNVTRL